MDRLSILLIVSMGATLLLMLFAEKIRPARQFPEYRGWVAIGMAVMVLFIALANAWSLAIPKKWLHEHRMLNGEPLGGVGGIAIWYVVNTFVTYWYHRCQHRFSLTWRLLHQVHHGVVRVDIPSAMMAHPLDVITSATLSIVVTSLVLGLDPRAVVVIGGLQFFMTLMPHWNVRTPAWLGYFVQRPEEHILHHQRGIHAGNYSDWPFWDKVFGTYRAPLAEPVAIGYDKAGVWEQLKMLAFIDVNAEQDGNRRSYDSEGNMNGLFSQNHQAGYHRNKTKVSQSEY